MANSDFKLFQKKAIASAWLVLVMASPVLARRSNNEKLANRLKAALLHYQQGSALHDQGNLDGAIAEYQEALRGDPDEPYWRQALGDALNKQGNGAAALEEYRLASQLSPHDSGLRSKYEELQKKLNGGAGSEPAKAAATPETLSHVGGGVSAPVSQFHPEPPYSEKARIAKYQGTTMLWIIIDAQGSVSDVSVAKPLFLGLSEQAIETVRTWQFQPAMRGGAPIPVRVAIEVTFRLY